MEDSNWLDAIRFYTLPLAERRELLLAQHDWLLDKQNRLVIEFQLAKLEEHQEEVVASRRD